MFTMKKIFLILVLAGLLFRIDLFAQVGSIVNYIKIYDANNNPKEVPYIGQKVVLILYTDPDVKDVNDPLSNALKAKNFPKEKYQGVGIANCDDTWVPNAAIRMKARQKEKQYPGSVVMIDTDKTLPKIFSLSDCNEKGVLILIGKDKKIKLVKYISSQDESKAAINEVVNLISAEIAK
jgi:uncharacterized protein